LSIPLSHPDIWRQLFMRPPAGVVAPQAPVTLDQVQELADAYGAAMQLRQPVWMANFRLHHRAARTTPAAPGFPSR
jgi:hypothetical protein